MAANKVVFGNKVLIDLTGDTVTEEALLKGYTAHKADGTIITGTAFAYPPKGEDPAQRIRRNLARYF